MGYDGEILFHKKPRCSWSKNKQCLILPPSKKNLFKIYFAWILQETKITITILWYYYVWYLSIWYFPTSMSKWSILLRLVIKCFPLAFKVCNDGSFCRTGSILLKNNTTRQWKINDPNFNYSLNTLGCRFPNSDQIFSNVNFIKIFTHSFNLFLFSIL